MDSESDPLEMTESDNFALFDGCFDNIEFVVENEEEFENEEEVALDADIINDEVGTEDMIVIQIESLETNVEGDNVTVPVPEPREIIDLRSPSPIEILDEEIIKDEVDIKDEEVEPIHSLDAIQITRVESLEDFTTLPTFFEDLPIQDVQTELDQLHNTNTNKKTSVPTSTAKVSTPFSLKNAGSKNIASNSSAQKVVFSAELNKSNKQVTTSRTASNFSSKVQTVLDTNNIPDKVHDSPCYVPNCTTDLESCKRKTHRIHLFGAPADENLRKLWDIAIDRTDKRLQKKDSVCERHFKETDLIQKVVVPGEHGEITVPFTKPRLKLGAVPCILFHEECCVPKCGNREGPMYCFPVSNSSQYDLWLYLIKNRQLKNKEMKDVVRHRVCERHFEKSCFDKHKRLTRHAAPTLNVPVHSSDLLAMADDDLPESAPKKTPEVNGSTPQATKVMAHRNCAYKGCPNQVGSNKSFFIFPPDLKSCETWVKACGRDDDLLSDATTFNTRHLLCQDHFNKDNFVIPFKKLKPNAVPRMYYYPSTTDLDFRTSKAFSSKDKTFAVQWPTNGETISNGKSQIVVNHGYQDPKPLVTSKVCVYVGCKNTVHSLPLFSFPANRSECNAWIAACGYGDLSKEARSQFIQNAKICSKHFAADMFEDDSLSKLKATASPTPFKPDKHGADPIPVVTDFANNTGSRKPAKKLLCAVQDCSVTLRYGSLLRRHLFPNPQADPERYSMWVQLLASSKIANRSSDDICTKFMVCSRHFESHFYEKTSGRSMALSPQAVPTLQLTADIRWFFNSEYYKTRLQEYYKTLVISESPPDLHIEWRECDATDKKVPDEPADATKCVLEKDRISFPGMGRYLYLGSGKRPYHTKGKRKFPFGVYRYSNSGYKRADDVEVGESIKIHTAIIIDDDDECEQMVLQQLFEKRTKKVT